ncbi:MAG: hypothetical protein Q7T26_10115 [Dehalococcoidia bacterium]|nr:hypothetical protein [Dehalococcoidia bacterium]
MGQGFRQGYIVLGMKGKTKASTRDKWSQDLDNVWDEIAPVMRKQKGFLGVKALWNIANNQEMLLLAYWERLADRLAYENSVAGGLRARMETILQGMPSRPKYRMIRDTRVELSDIKGGHLVTSLTATSRASSPAEFEHDLGKVWDRPGRIDASHTDSPFLGAQVIWSIDGTREACLLTFWRSLEKQSTHETTAPFQTGAKFQEILEPPIVHSQYVIIKSV